jgi:hypothetical protein
MILAIQRSSNGNFSTETEYLSQFGLTISVKNRKPFGKNKLKKRR